MGLDITAYSQLKSLGKHTQGEERWCQNEDHIIAFAYSDFPHSFRGIPVLAEDHFSGDGTAFLEGGCYEETPDTKTHKFRAGSYMGYGRWRENLARQFNPHTRPEDPFYELIWFADNEGCIGPEAAVDLLADFRAHAGEYQPYFQPQDTYQDWTRAFELAADGGLVRFH